MAFVLISVLIFMIRSSASECDRCLHQSKATYTSQIYSRGCGYGPLAWNFNGGLLASGLPSLFQKGAGCGACFKVRCKNNELCKEEGTPIILTDSQCDNRTDFVLNKDAFSAMANHGKALDLLNLGIVDIEYISAVRVESYSQWPHYLAISILYQGGQTNIDEIQIATVGQPVGTRLRHSYGAVWETKHAPAGPLRIGFLVTAENDNFSLYRSEVDLPSNWTNGVIYNIGVQISDIAPEKCYPCDHSTW